MKSYYLREMNLPPSGAGTELGNKFHKNGAVCRPPKPHAEFKWTLRSTHSTFLACVTAALCMVSPLHATALKAPTEAQIAADRKAGFKGEYFLTRSQDPICIPITKNLNQFRKLDFDDCHPRLSEKFPEFSRPEWREVPLDMAIAERAFMGISFSRSKPGLAERWDKWLADTEQLRAAGKIKMWLTDVDINNDGVVDPIARVQYAHPASGWPVQRRSCVYSHSGLWKLSPNSKGLYNGQDHFYFGTDTDIIHYSGTNMNYSVAWYEGQVGPISEGLEIGATRGVLVEHSLTAAGTPVPVCYINWVRTGKFRPLQRKASTLRNTK